MLIHAPSGRDLRVGAAAYPGFPLKTGPERSQLRPGESRRLSLTAGDVVTIINDEGAARVRLLAFDGDGRADPGLIGLERKPSTRPRRIWRRSRPGSGQWGGSRSL